MCGADLGLLLLDCGEREQVARLFELLCGSFPSSHDLWCNLGLVYIMMDRVRSSDARHGK